MIITRIYFNNFKNFIGDHSFKLSKINLISGENGKGKSTLAVDSILFTLFGYSSQTLEKLITRSLKKKEGKVRVELEDKGKKIIIERMYPTALNIFENGIKLQFPNTKESQEYLNRLFNNLEWFRKFRMVDSKEGINILEEGKTSIKKTLLSLQENWFNNIRQELLDKKRERETFNKDKCIWKHFPSENRLRILIDEIKKIETEYSNLSKEISNQNRLVTEMTYKVGKIQGQKEFHLSKLNKIAELDICPTCTQEVTKETKQTVKENLQVEIDKCIEEVEPFKKDIGIEKEIVLELEKVRNNSNYSLIKLRELKDRLETAIKQKDFKFTKKDVLIMDKCIKELDNFYGYFITEWIRTLEPIINNVLDKIGFKISFKDDFDIVLHREGEEYSYKDLSTGQKLILSIAMKLAILLERNERGLVIADEGFSSLDEENLSYILKLFKDLPFQLIAIIHRYQTEDEEVNLIAL